MDVRCNNQIRDFFDTRVFGPDRAALLKEQIPCNAAQAAEQHARQRDRLDKELARINLAQRSQITQIDTLDSDPANSAAQAMRQRCYERFTELQAEREATQTQLDALDRTAPRDNDTSLLDLIPLLADTIALHPEHIQAALYQAFDIQALYKDDMNQVTFFATITTSTPPSRRRHPHRRRLRPHHHQRWTAPSPQHQHSHLPFGTTTYERLF
jgi:site-specific DNA recombinase